MDDFGSQAVELYIYDMTQGMAAMMSPMLLGKYHEFISWKCFVYDFKVLFVKFSQTFLLISLRHRSSNRWSVAHSGGRVWPRILLWISRHNIVLASEYDLPYVNNKTLIWQRKKRKTFHLEWTFQEKQFWKKSRRKKMINNWYATAWDILTSLCQIISNRDTFFMSNYRSNECNYDCRSY